MGVQVNRNTGRFVFLAAPNHKNLCGQSAPFVWDTSLLFAWTAAAYERGALYVKTKSTGDSWLGLCNQIQKQSIQNWKNSQHPKTIQCIANSVTCTLDAGEGDQMQEHEACGNQPAPFVCRKPKPWGMVCVIRRRCRVAQKSERLFNGQDNLAHQPLLVLSCICPNRESYTKKPTGKSLRPVTTSKYQ